ncbi:LysR family transcriptional regulator [Marinomonas algarum]|uniref:LysR family transcriptional regulator n=1 Tax=Marinomonas algarum TaxID=2883105 RepID=A0A9X1LDL5_9GAMM|nr:LysR family transcriptional regulator [Marinomonas algarum]MCB5162687.1 LysR family transcriptional regulator [Marinomonas algarum]
MDFKTLKSFVSVATHRSFSGAAKDLNTVQPAVSRHISMLEEELGVTLFERSSRQVTITRAGRQLLKDATQILSLSNQAKQQVIRAHNGDIGSLTIAYLPSACLTFMAPLVRRYRERYPKVTVRLLEMTVSEQIEAFLENKIDIGFSRPLPPSLQHDFLCHDVYTDQLVAIVSSDHPLAHQKEVDLKALETNKFILFNREEAVGLFDDVILMCKEAGFSPNIISQPKHMQTLLTEVSAGFGVGIGPYCIRKLYSEGCHFLSIKQSKKAVMTELQYKASDQDALITAFVDITLKERTAIQQSMQ